MSDFDIRYVSRLARVALTSEEEEKLGTQLALILGYIAKLKEVDVTGVEPTAHAFPLVNVTRADVPGSSLTSEEALQNAPDQYGPFERLPVAFGVLLRLVWLTLHPGAGLHDVPSPLLRSQSPSWWRYDASADGSIPLFQGLLPELTLFFRGQSDVVIDRLASVVGNHPFEQQWRERDVETLRNFFTRSFGDE
jgi:aspartyl-tRNA(Asn)/glutamyl-tRNA(Gln) amidotransferase subunit C